MTKLNMYNEMLGQLAFYLGSVNYARCGYANDNAKFEHDAFSGFNALSYFAETIGLQVETIGCSVDDVYFYAGVRLYAKGDKGYTKVRWCTSCSERIDHLTHMRLQEFIDVRGYETD